MTPQEIFKKYKRQSLGMLKASPSSIKSQVSSKHFIFIVSCTVVLFLERLLFRFRFGFSFAFLLSLLNKLVGPPLSYIGLQIVSFGLEKSRKVHAYVVKRACF